MIFQFEINDSKTYSQMHQVARTAFWKRERTHIYRQIIFYKDERKELKVITNEIDWIDFCQTIRSLMSWPIYMAFISWKYTNIHAGLKHTAPYHAGVTCDGCGIDPIIGVIYTCLMCTNYKLCEVCEANDCHAPHVVLALPRAQICGTISAPETHELIGCDSCEVQPIIGFRYRCLSCTNVHYCADCFAHKPLQCNFHQIIRLPIWYGVPGAPKTNAQQLGYDRQFETLANFIKLEQMVAVATQIGETELLATPPTRVNPIPMIDKQNSAGNKLEQKVAVTTQIASNPVAEMELLTISAARVDPIPIIDKRISAGHKLAVATQITSNQAAKTELPSTSRARVDPTPVINEQSTAGKTKKRRKRTSRKTVR